MVTASDRFVLILLIATVVALQFASCLKLSSHEESFIENELNNTGKHNRKHGHLKQNNNRTANSTKSTKHHVNCARWYTSVKSEGCFDIAAGFGLDRKEFKKLNPTINCSNELKEKTKICLREAVKRSDSSEELEGLNALMNGHTADTDALERHFDVKMAHRG